MPIIFCAGFICGNGMTVPIMGMQNSTGVLFPEGAPIGGPSGQGTEAGLDGQ